MTLGRRSFLQLIPGAALAATSVRTGSAADAKPLHVGSILSVTGPAAFLGEDMKAGLQLAVDEINATGGIGGRKIAWTFYDAESQTQKAISETRRLISQDKVDFIVSGGNMSGIALAIAPMAEAAKMPFISSEGALQIVTPVSNRKWVFKSTVDDEHVLERIADYLASRRNSKKLRCLRTPAVSGRAPSPRCGKWARGATLKSSTSFSVPATPI